MLILAAHSVGNRTHDVTSEAVELTSIRVWHMQAMVEQRAIFDLYVECLSCHNPDPHHRQQS